MALQASRLRFPPAHWQRQARLAVASAGVLAYPTESCFGLGCDPRQRPALQKVLALKRRPKAKGMLLIASDLAQILPFIQPPSADDLARFAQWWPGPLTLLLPASRRVVPLLRGRHRKIAVRITDHPPAAGLCHFLGMPLVSTSANLSGRVALKRAADCRRVFGRRVLTLPGMIGLARKPSSIIDYPSGRILRG